MKVTLRFELSSPPASEDRLRQTPHTQSSRLQATDLNIGTFCNGRSSDHDCGVILVELFRTPGLPSVKFGKPIQSRGRGMCWICAEYAERIGWSALSHGFMFVLDIYTGYLYWIFVLDICAGYWFDVKVTGRAVTL